MFNPFKRKQNKQASEPPALTEQLELAKQQLITALEKNGMVFLVTKLGSNEDYSELIAERRKTVMSFSSEDTVAWYAYLESDKLHSPKDKETLLGMLPDDKYRDYKKYIYQCLASICANTNDRDLFNFLIARMKEEQDESIRVSILSRVARVIKESGYNIEPIKLLVKEGTANEIHAAVKALSNTNDPEVEDILLDEFKISNTHMKGMICGPLATAGTLKSIPILKEAYKKTRDGFLRTVIEEAISKIASRAS